MHDEYLSLAINISVFFSMFVDWPIWNFDNLNSHRIHGTGIVTYIWLIFMVNVGKYTSPMNPMDPIEEFFLVTVASVSGKVPLQPLRHVQGAAHISHGFRRQFFWNFNTVWKLLRSYCIGVYFIYIFQLMFIESLLPGSFWNFSSPDFWWGFCCANLLIAATSPMSCQWNGMNSDLRKYNKLMWY